MAVVSPRHPWAKKKVIVPEAFADQHVILYAMTRAESTLLSQVLEPSGVTPRQVSHIELTEAIVELVKAELGVGFLAHWAVAPHLRDGTLCAIPTNHPAAQRHWSAAVRREHATHPHIAAFLELARQSLVEKRGAPLKLVQA
jgi:LysR family transcriptional regulator for metE and metH